MSKKTPPPHFDMARREIKRWALIKVRIFIPYLAPTNDLVITKAESHKQKTSYGIVFDFHHVQKCGFLVEIRIELDTQMVAPLKKS